MPGQRGGGGARAGEVPHPGRVVSGAGEHPKPVRAERGHVHRTGAIGARIAAKLPELGRLSGRQGAALVGLAPPTRESGRRRHRATIGHGRPLVRRALFNAARPAIRHPSPLRAFHERLVTHYQRPGKVAPCAVMREPLIIANALARDKQPWKQQPA